MLVGIRIALHSLRWIMVLLLSQGLRHLDLTLIVLVIHLRDNMSLRLAHPHYVLLLLDQEFVQILLHSWIDLCFLRLQHVTKSLIYSPQVLYLQVLLMLDLFIL